MKNLTYNEKIAVMRILLDIVLADNRVDERETMFYDKIALELELGQMARQDVDKQNSLLALAIIHDLPMEQKCSFAKLMGQMIIVDEDINYNEVIIYNVVNKFCDINIDFDASDYPEYLHD